MEPIVLMIFIVMLVGSMIAGIPLPATLLAGLALFIAYGLLKGHKPAALLKMCLTGVHTVGNVLICFVLVGALTAWWRASGCIPALVCYASGLVSPKVFLLATFLLCALVSFMMGTAFGTAATMGVILMSMAVATGIPVVPVGGAILAGVYFGDRCSPVSTCALLVSTLTKTDIYKNIRAMFRSAAVPFAAACAVYLLLGSKMDAGGATTEAGELLRSGFRISPLCLLPAACILVPAMFRLDVKKTMLISAAASLPVALWYQGAPLGGLLASFWKGYHAASPELAAMIDGGGLRSMLRAGVIVSVASCYSGLFNGTGMLDFLERPVRTFSKKCGFYPTAFVVSLVTGMVACNQTLTIMLSNRLLEGADAPKEEQALALADTAVILSPLIPWSIAGTVSLAAVGAPTGSILFACYLYFIPLWRFAAGFFKRKKRTL